MNFAAQGMVAESWLNPNHWYRTNVLAQVALHDSLRQKPFLQKYVHVTTPEVYEIRRWRIKEHNNFAPSTPYAVSRAACDLHLHSFHQAYGFRGFHPCCQCVWTGTAALSHHSSHPLSARTSEPMELQGGGHSVRAFIHIKDVVRATLQLLLKEHRVYMAPFHLERCSIKDLVEQLCTLAGANFSEIVRSSEERLGRPELPAR